MDWIARPSFYWAVFGLKSAALADFSPNSFWHRSSDLPAEVSKKPVDAAWGGGGVDKGLPRVFRDLVCSIRSRFPLPQWTPTLLSFVSALSGASSPPVAAATRNPHRRTKGTCGPGIQSLPLSLFGGSGNYASALFLAASKANMVDKVESEILDIVEASKRSLLFSQFIKDLSVPREIRVKAVKEVFAEAGFSDITKNFLAVLADNGRLRHVERISKRFVELAMAYKGEVKVIVTTVIPLPAEEEKELKQILQ